MAKITFLVNYDLKYYQEYSFSVYHIDRQKRETFFKTVGLLFTRDSINHETEHLSELPKGYFICVPYASLN